MLLPVFLFNLRAVLQKNVMRAAFHQRGCGNNGDFRFFLQFGNGKHTTVAHRGFYLFQGKPYVVMQAAGIGNIGVNAFLKGKLCRPCRISASFSLLRSPRPSIPSCRSR